MTFCQSFVPNSDRVRWGEARITRHSSLVPRTSPLVSAKTRALLGQRREPARATVEDADVLEDNGRGSIILGKSCLSGNPGRDEQSAE